MTGFSGSGSSGAIVRAIAAVALLQCAAAAAAEKPDQGGHAAAKKSSSVRGHRQIQPAVPLARGLPANALPADPAKVTIEHRPSGERIYHLNGQGMQAAIAHIGADGKIQLQCTDRVDNTLVHEVKPAKHDEH